MTRLARAKHLLQSRLLSRADAQAVVALDLDPSGSVVAVDVGLRRLPLIRAAVALVRVGGAGDSPQLRTLDVVGEGLALRGGPLRGTGDPGVLERNHVVDGHVAGLAVCLAVEGACPCAGSGVAVVANLDAVAITAEDELTEEYVSQSLNKTCEQTYRALQLPSTDSQWGNRSRS